MTGPYRTQAPTPLHRCRCGRPMPLPNYSQALCAVCVAYETMLAALEDAPARTVAVKPAGDAAAAQAQAARTVKAVIALVVMVVMAALALADYCDRL